jgi:uncharacterized membrane protein
MNGPGTRVASKVIVFVIFGALLIIWLLNTPPGLLGKADAIGYAVCHRIENRSFSLGGRQMPLCIRCSGMYLGMLLGLGYLSIVNPRRGGLPSRGNLAVLGLLFLAFAVDGLNSLLHLIPGLPSFYPPSHLFRLLTGTGMGLVLAVMLFLALNQTAWQEWNPLPVLGGRWTTAGWTFLALGLMGLIWTQNPLILYPAALVSAAGVWFSLSLVYMVFWLILTRQDNRFNSPKQIVIPFVIGLTVALLQILIFDWIRYTLTGTWGGFFFE